MDKYFILGLISILICITTAAIPFPRPRKHNCKDGHSIKPIIGPLYYYDVPQSPDFVHLPQDLKSDEDLTVQQLIAKNGYPVETHHVTTKDGYILEVHRIPHGRKNFEESNKPAVFLQHGLLASSADWIMNTVDKALAYQLADQGYDVFLGNARGNTYSRNHTSLSPKSKAFWNFSFNEIALYDIPAIIDHILETTQQTKIFYIGHSMGTIVFWITMSHYPEYNQKIRLMSALAPVAYLKHIKSPVRLLAPFSSEAELVIKLFGDREFLPHRGIINIFRRIVCDHEPIGEEICENFVFLIAGFDKSELNLTMLPVILGHTPAGTSTHTIIHFAQGVNSGNFCPFDYGKKTNMQIYGQKEPPPYNLKKVEAPVALFWAENDWLSATQDVAILAGKLQNVVLNYRVPYEKFSHLDFVFAIDADKYVYSKVLEIMKKY